MYTGSIGSIIAGLRKEKGVTQEELAKKVGVSAQAVSKWENGGVPDMELIPDIADYFGVSIGTLFGRDINNYSDIREALCKNIINTSLEDGFKLAFEYCWDIEKALCGVFAKEDSLEKYRDEYDKTSQIYSSVVRKWGFTRMGIVNRSQYFLIVPEAEDKTVAYFDVDYVSFFKDFSDKDVFDACVMLNKRDNKKAFTPMLLVNNMGISSERALEIIKILDKYSMIDKIQLEVDDGMLTNTAEANNITKDLCYSFRPTPSFIALLIFAHEMIECPRAFSYYVGEAEKPLLE